MAMRPYVIRQGDHLLKLGHILGFDADKVWNDGKNQEIKQARKDPAMLRPGDVLFIPDEPKKRLKVNAKETNAYVARVPTVRVEVVLSEDDEPIKDERYVLEGIGDDTEHKTDGEGRVSFEVPVHVREVTVKLLDRKSEMKIAIGDLDPPDTPSGARMRLTSLGYYGASADGADRWIAHEGEAVAAALRAFQKEKGLSATGELDEATQAALVEAHGS